MIGQNLMNDIPKNGIMKFRNENTTDIKLIHFIIFALGLTALRPNHRKHRRHSTLNISSKTFHRSFPVHRRHSIDARFHIDDWPKDYYLRGICALSKASTRFPYMDLHVCGSLDGCSMSKGDLVSAALSFLFVSRHTEGECLRSLDPWPGLTVECVFHTESEDLFHIEGRDNLSI